MTAETGEQRGPVAGAKRFVAADAAVAAFIGGPPVDARAFRSDLDRVVFQASDLRSDPA